jgi:hypothetical protein
VNNDVPVVTSGQVPWVAPRYRAKDETSVDEIVQLMGRALADKQNWVRKLVFGNPNKERLRAFTELARELWLAFLA